jgi:RNase P/RNase MRP subunit p29
VSYFCCWSYVNIFVLNFDVQTIVTFRYVDLLDLYKLWCEYFQEVVDLVGRSLDVRMLKADYHGCLLRVSYASNSSQIGLYGIVAHESKHTFQLVTKQDRVIGGLFVKQSIGNLANSYSVIPKQGTTFQFVLNAKVYTLFGDAMKQKSYLRGRKAKHRTTLPFLLK